MTDHNSPRMLDELLSITGWHYVETMDGATLVYPPADSHLKYWLFKLADYVVASAVSGPGYRMAKR